MSWRHGTDTGTASSVPNTSCASLVDHALPSYTLGRTLVGHKCILHKMLPKQRITQEAYWLPCNQVQ